MSEQFQISFYPSGRGKAQCAPNPEYPNGVAMDISCAGSQTCSAALPYPAPECGAWLVDCRLCGLRVAITAVGRPDDPISLKMSCDVSRATEEAAHV